MHTVMLLFPVLYFLSVLGLCTFLLIRGVTHLFVGLFAGGALLGLVSPLGFLVLQQAPGGFSANTRYLPFLNAFGMLGTCIFVAGFVSLAAFLLRVQKTSA